MRILVLSDSHGRESAVESAVAAHPEAKEIIFLGDGHRDIEQVAELYPDRTYHIVRGNCDGGAFTLPDEGFECFGGVNILFAHGHTYGVKYSTDRMLAAALERGAQIMLYGHTHLAVTDYDSGVYLLNPGSIGNSGTYGAIDILPSGILTSILHL